MTGTMPVTETVEKQSTDRNDMTITVVDTPGLTNVSSFKDIAKEIHNMFPFEKQMNIFYLITIKIGRCTLEETEILNDIFKTKKTVMKNAIIIFTNKSELRDDTACQSVDQWIQNNQSISKWKNDNKLEHCAFENKRSDKEEKDVQVKELIDMVRQIDEKDEFTCDVSEHMNTKNKIYVDVQTLRTKFGDYGLEFYEEQKALQKKNM